MIRHIFSVTFLFVAGLIIFNQTACTPTLDPPSPQAGSCNFSTTVAVGGDFMAGYQDGALYYLNQYKSIPRLLTGQFREIDSHNGLCGGISVLNNENGLGWNLKPWESWFTTYAHLGYNTDCLGVRSLMPLSDSVSRSAAWQNVINTQSPSTPFNVSVPFGTTPQMFDPAMENYNPAVNTNPFFKRTIQHTNYSVMDEAVDRNASFFLAWLGMEDIYNYAQLGGTGAGITPSGTFSMYLDSALSRLTANGAKGVIANIPDFRDFPFYTLVPWNGANLTQSKADSLNDIFWTSGDSEIVFHQGDNGFIIGDANNPHGYRQMHEGEYLLLDIPLDSMKCNFYGILVNLINDRYVLDSSEVANIDAAIASYNSIIAQKATQYNLALVDMNTYFHHVQSGIKWDGVDFNTEFVTGGFYSLDGYHPNQKGYALITNEFISAINAKYGSTIPTLNCFDCNGILFP